MLINNEIFDTLVICLIIIKIEIMLTFYAEEEDLFYGICLPIKRIHYIDWRHSNRVI